MSAASHAFASFREFYPYYLSEHCNRSCRRLHYLGSTLALLCVAMLIVSGNPWWLLAGFLSGYACAWIGHYGFENNRPATFKHPFYSFAGDWVMFADMLRGKIRF